MKNILKSTTFLAILAIWLWSTAFVGIKIGLKYHTPLQFAGIRFFLAGILIFLFINKKGSLIYTQIKSNVKIILSLSVVQIILQYALFYNGLNLVPGALGAMIIGSSPLFVAIVAHFSFRDDKLTPLKIFSILIGVVGIAIITLARSKVQIKGEYEYLGIILLLLNNLVAGYANVIVAKSPSSFSPHILSSSSLILGGGLLFLISIPIEGFNLGPFPFEYYLSLGWLSFLSAAAFSIWFSLLKRPKVKVSELNTWKFLIPVSGALLSWIILENEQPDLISIAGMIVIATSLIILNISNKKIK